MKIKLVPASWVHRLAKFMHQNKSLFIDYKWGNILADDALSFRYLLPNERWVKDVPYDTCRNLCESGFELKGKTEKYILEDVLSCSNGSDVVLIKSVSRYAGG